MASSKTEPERGALPLPLAFSIRLGLSESFSVVLSELLFLGLTLGHETVFVQASVSMESSVAEKSVSPVKSAVVAENLVGTDRSA